MNKKIYLLFALIVATISVKAQDSQCENLAITKTEIGCAFPITTLNAEFLNSGYKTADVYIVNGDTPCPPQYAQPTTANISPDDAWAPVIFNLGFNFCFYGNTYDQVVISGNGVVSFDIAEVQDYIATNPNGNGPFHVWNTDASLDLPDINLAPNAIFGPYTDPNPATAPIPTETIKFDLLNQDQPGNRVFVIEYDVPMYSCSSEYLHSFIKLYETSNIIDVEILEKGRCDGWENSTGIVGIQNKSATLATVVPGRRNADGGWWVNGDPAHGGNPAEQELWRFIPDGNDLGYEFKWYADYGQGNGYEQLFPNQPIDPPSVEVNPATQTEYKAVLRYQTECSFDQIVLEQTLIVDAPDQENVQSPVDLYSCETSFGVGTADFDIDQFDELLTEYINSTSQTWDMSNFTVSYYAFADDRENGNSPIDVTTDFNTSDNTTIYIAIEYDDGTINCFDVYREFILHVTSLADTTFNYDQSIYCSVDDDPTPTALTIGGEYSIDNGGIINPLTGQVDITASDAGDDSTGIFNITYSITVSTYDQDNNLLTECIGSTEVTISLEVIGITDFTYPTTACLSDNNPAPLQFNTGGVFTINNGGVIDSITGEIDLTNTAAGVYEITYEMNANGNCPSSSTQNITIFEEDDASFTYPNSMYCNDDTNPLPTAVTSGGTYSINNGGVLIDSLTGEVDLTTSALGVDGTGNFEISYTTSGNCPNTTILPLTIIIREDASFSFSTDVCFYDANPQAFDVVTTGGVFSVNNGASIDNNGVLDLTTTTPGTTYEITYGFLTGFCTSLTSQNVTVRESPIANTPSILTECDNGDGTANFDLTAIEDEIVGNQNVLISYHPTYQDAEDNTNMINTIPSARVDGNVFARVENTFGCVSIVEVSLIIENCYTVLPSGFSPNSSIEENQTFDVSSLHYRYPDFKLYIYNRFGRLVYEGDANTDNWNGKINNEGVLLPVGSYFYILKLNDEQELTDRGWVYLQQ